MIPGFFIEKLEVTGPEKETAKIHFNKGLNVVSGPSDTGKSYLLQCIDYMMGGYTKPKDIEEARGYDIIWMQISTYEGTKYTLRRKIGESKFSLYNKNISDSIKASSFETISARHNSTKDDNISAFLLNILKLNSKQLKENAYSKRSVRFGDIKTIFIKDENEIISENSPIATGQYTSRTVEKSLFNLLLSGEDDEELALVENPELYKSMIKGKLELTQNLLENEEENAKELKESVSEMGQEEVNLKIEQLSLSINESNQLIREQENSRNNILKKLNQVDEHKIHLTELLERFALLEQHYISDLERLEFMLEGENLLSQLPTVPCPTCGSEIDSKEIKQFIEEDTEKIAESIDKERTKINAKKSNLTDTIQDITQELEKTKERENILENELQQISTILEKKLKPVHNVLKEDLEGFASLKQDIARLDDAKERITKYTQNIERMKEKLKEKKPTSEKRILPEEHYKKFCKKMKQQLAEWDIKVDSIQFDKTELDFVINGKARKNHGKGLRAILCTAFLISLMKYCKSQETYHTRSLVIDSPLTTFRMGDQREEDDEVSSDVQGSFFKNLAEMENEYQIIIFDNKDPEESLRDSITYHHFTRNKNFGRFGFFPIE